MLLVKDFFKSKYLCRRPGRSVALCFVLFFGGQVLTEGQIALLSDFLYFFSNKNKPVSFCKASNVNSLTIINGHKIQKSWAV